MTFEGYRAFNDPYVYNGTSVLKNKLKTRDAAALTVFEIEMTAVRAAEPPPTGRFGPAHFRAVHRHLFQDVYSWAGHSIDLGRIQPEEFLRAMILSFSGDVGALTRQIVSLRT
jgi:fido (protein-threonine AMPylation protein)